MEMRNFLRIITTLLLLFTGFWGAVLANGDSWNSSSWSSSSGSNSQNIDLFVESDWVDLWEKPKISNTKSNANGDLDLKWAFDEEMNNDATRVTGNEALNKLNEDKNFFTISEYWVKGTTNFVIRIAKEVKNIVFIIATIYLLITVFKILFSENTEEEVGSAKKAILWTAIWIIVMQMAFIIVESLYWNQVNAWVAYDFAVTAIYPIIKLLMFATGAFFILMMIFAFYRIVTAWGDEEKVSTWRFTAVNAVVGFLIIKISGTLVESVYWKIWCNWKDFFGANLSCKADPNISDTVKLATDIINWANGFIFFGIVVLVIYAGYKMMLSWGDEEEMKKGKAMIKYIIIGLAMIIWSYLAFTFFIYPSDSGVASPAPNTTQT